MAGTKQGDSLTVNPYVGDNKTLLAFDFTNVSDAKNLAGFTIACKPPGQPSYYLFNYIVFEDPGQHFQVATEDPQATVNAPLQMYRWTHVPGTNHQGLVSAVGNYVYTVTPRYFDAKASMQALDPTLSVSVTVNVGPFRKGSLALGFTRGYMQSGAFVNHFGVGAQLQPAGKPLLYDTTQKAGTNKAGQNFTFADEYAWMGSTARQQVFAILNAVLQDPTLHVDVFAYDLDEPDVLKILLALGKQGRARVILDNAALHLSAKGKTSPEDAFTTLFNKQAQAPAKVLRGCFDRYSHDKVFIIYKGGAATQVLTGSTNFSVTGLYVNANHVLVFDDAAMATEYAKVFAQGWQILTQYPNKSAKASAAFSATALSSDPFTIQSASLPKISITFSPHTQAEATTILTNLSNRITAEAGSSNGSVLYAVMQLTGSDTPVYNTLKSIYENKSVFSYGISDAPGGTHLYAPGHDTGVLVTGKPGKTMLPAPFDQVPSPPGHEIHDKFVVCGLNGKDPVVYCGSSNLATGGEQENGDNLLEIHDQDIAAAFAIEALLLVDHYNFLDRWANAKNSSAAASKTAAKNTSAKAKTVKKR
jgi:PLD-like domain